MAVILPLFTSALWGGDLSAGGSSGGSASTLAAGIVPIATGSDYTSVDINSLQVTLVR